VDDEPELCWVLETIIRNSGFSCRTALSAGEAMVSIESCKYCMAFIDAKLQDNDGIELARLLRKTDVHLPIVIVSGYFYQDDLSIEGALQSGLIDAFIGKPFDHDEIVSVIVRYTSR
jgi:DNA-binding NtrC family response regulator